MKRLILGASLAWCILSCVALAAEPVATPNVVVTLSAPAEPVAVGDVIELQLKVENQGDSPVRLIRPRRDEVTRIREYGWIVRIEGPPGVFGKFPEPREIKPITQDVMIELAPGEFVGAAVRVDHYALLSQPTRPHRLLGETPGSYRAVATYHVRRDGPFYTLDLREGLLMGPVSSAQIEFEVVNQKSLGR